jgi:hypothetical protein
VLVFSRDGSRFSQRAGVRKQDFDHPEIPWGGSNFPRVPGFFAFKFADGETKSGVAKLLKDPCASLAQAECDVLNCLTPNDVPYIPSCELIAEQTIFFDKLLAPVKHVNRNLLGQFLDCLEKAHTVNVVHRDVRPENLMVDQDGQPILNDWGFATLDCKQAVSLEGTFRFASEEVLQAAIQGVSRVPCSKDDLHSLLRSVLSILHPSIGCKLAEFGGADFGAVSLFWKTWQAEHQVFEPMFVAAEKLEYSALLQLAG